MWKIHIYGKHTTFQYHLINIQHAWFQASAVKSLRIVLFWVIMQGFSGNFSPTFWDKLSVPLSGFNNLNIQHFYWCLHLRDLLSDIENWFVYCVGVLSCVVHRWVTNGVIHTQLVGNVMCCISETNFCWNGWYEYSVWVCSGSWML
jgi:hypothetical protein